MRERILLRHIGQQALQSLDDNDFTEEMWQDYMKEMVMDIALMLATQPVEDFSDARKVIEYPR